MGHESRGGPVFSLEAAEPESDVSSGRGPCETQLGGTEAALDQPEFQRPNSSSLTPGHAHQGHEHRPLGEGTQDPDDVGVKTVLGGKANCLLSGPQRRTLQQTRPDLGSKRKRLRPRKRRAHRGDVWAFGFKVKRSERPKDFTVTSPKALG